MPGIDNSSLFKLSYGLFVLTAKGERDCGCIINTAQQVTQSPLTISIAVNKANYTHQIIMETKQFNISVLQTDVPFEIFKRFGFSSGKDTDKFKDFNGAKRAENGIYYLTEFSNAFISGKVIDTVDIGTHTLFIAQVTEAETIGNKESVTYQYYFDHIKPKPEAEKKKGYVCKICGYVYEGESLPDDFICPLCKHPASDFEPLT